jgi:hypothetical protein
MATSRAWTARFDKGPGKRILSLEDHLKLAHWLAKALHDYTALDNVEPDTPGRLCYKMAGINEQGSVFADLPSVQRSQAHSALLRFYHHQYNGRSASPRCCSRRMRTRCVASP